MKTIITCAITGSGTKPEQTPYLPITPEQIATSALEAAEAGASVIHLHVRDPLTGKPSSRVELYQDTVNQIKKYNNKDLFLYYRIGLVSKDYLCKRLEEMFSTKFLYLNFRNFNDHDVNHKVFEVLIKSVQCRSDYVLADEFFQEQNEPDWAEVLALKKGYLLK